MKSKAGIKSHPIHAILVPFPIAFFTGSLVLDVLGFFTTDADYSIAAGFALAGGLISAVLAAIPGAIDYFYTVPPKSSAKKRGTRHALINTGAVFVFALALLMKSNERVSMYVIIPVEFAGVVLISIGGWLGGTLVVRNQIGVDHRYAQAGKWKEIYLTAKANEVELSDLAGLKSGQMVLVHVNGKRIVIGRTESGIVAFEDRCSHRGGSLADGSLICGTVQCPWHGSQFDTVSGQVKAGPATERINVYPVSEKNGSYYLRLI